MSNFLAIATVTATLRSEVEHAATAAVAAAQVFMTRPDSQGGENASTRVHIYLYQVSPNAAWRNRDLPARNSNGDLVQRPRIALDLHYLLTFYGKEEDLEPQRMLGSVALAMHERPVLTHKRIEDTIGSYPFLVESNLDDDVELVKFTPLPLSLEELSKLWSVFFQTPYALSVAYQATVVLIESDVKPRPALPVLERGIFVEPFRHPTIERIRSEASELEPIQPDSTILIEGRQLQGQSTRLRIGSHELFTPEQVTDTQIRFPLSSIQTPESLRAGVQAVQVIQPRMMGLPGAEVEHVGAESNVAPMVLRPVIKDKTVIDSTAMTVNLHPPIHRTQRVILLLNDPANSASSGYTFMANLKSYQVTDRALTQLKAEGVPDAVLNVLSQIKGEEYPTEDGFWNGVEEVDRAGESQSRRSLILKHARPAVIQEPIKFDISGTPAGTYLLRVQVDGAESVLEVERDQSTQRIKKITGPTVTIP